MLSLTIMTLLAVGSSKRAPLPEDQEGRPKGALVHVNPEPSRILAYSSDIRPGEHSYSYNNETGNKIKAEEHGFLKNPESQSVEGSYSYVGDDGQIYSVKYVADENGFRADGDHLPKAPPISDAILKSLVQLPQTKEQQRA